MGTERRLAMVALLAATAGCSMAPAYRPPELAVPAAYRESQTPPDGWAVAEPDDDSARGAWWRMFGDPVLDSLEARIETASPTLAAALARYDAASAAARAAGADLWPDLSVGAAIERAHVAAARPLAGSGATYTNRIASGAFAYEVDLWGRVRDSVRAAGADAEASGGDLAAARLSLQAELADTYFRLRGLDAQARLLAQTVDAYARARALTVARHGGGIASGLDVGRADTLLASARAELSAVAGQRAAAEHRIAALVGAVASDFTVPPGALPADPPRVPAAAPSALLQRRPDIAAAERRIFAANARIGVARAALFPSLTLGAESGFNAARGDLFSTPAHFWALGPAQAVLSLFDGGRRQANIRISRAQYDEAAARYREAVLAAFREVEDGFAAERTLAQQAADRRAAAEAARRTEALALVRYRGGASDYLEVVTAQAAALDAERSALAVGTARMQAAVALVRALGGGVGD